MDSMLLTYLETLPTRDLTVEDENIDVFCWRMEELLRAGYSPIVAGALAERNAVDLHRACGLLATGCPEETAFMILY